MPLPPHPHNGQQKGKREPREQWHTLRGVGRFAPARSARHVDRIIVWHAARGLAGETVFRSAGGKLIRTGGDAQHVRRLVVEMGIEGPTTPCGAR